MEDGYAAENRYSHAFGCHDTQRIHSDRNDGLNALVTDRGTLAECTPCPIGVTFDAVLPYALTFGNVFLQYDRVDLRKGAELQGYFDPVSLSRGQRFRKSRPNVQTE